MKKLMPNSAWSRRTIAAIIGVAALGTVSTAAAVAGSSPSGATNQTAGGSSAMYPSASTVESVVEAMAAENGDNALSTMTAFNTDRAHADAAVDDAGISGSGRVPSDAATVVYAQGKFAVSGARVLDPADAPTGTVLVVVLDSAGQVTDWGVEQAMPSAAATSTMGAPVTYTVGATN